MSSSNADIRSCRPPRRHAFSHAKYAEHAERAEHAGCAEHTRGHACGHTRTEGSGGRRPVLLSRSSSELGPALSARFNSRARFISISFVPVLQSRASGCCMCSRTDTELPQLACRSRHTLLLGADLELGTELLQLAVRLAALDAILLPVKLLERAVRPALDALCACVHCGAVHCVTVRCGAARFGPVWSGAGKCNSSGSRAA